MHIIIIKSEMKIDKNAKNELADYKSHKKKLPELKSSIIDAVEAQEREKITLYESRNE